MWGLFKTDIYIPCKGLICIKNSTKHHFQADFDKKMKSVEFANFLDQRHGLTPGLCKNPIWQLCKLDFVLYWIGLFYIKKWQICKNDIFIARKALIYILNINKTSLFGLFWRKIHEERKFSIFWPKSWAGGGGGYSHTLLICAAQRGRDVEAPDLEGGIHSRGVF